MTKTTKPRAAKAEIIIDQPMAHPVPAVPPSRSESLLAVIERASTMETVDVAKMQELYAMLKEMRADEAKAQFAADWVRMKPMLPMVIRTKRNTQTNSNYAPQEDVNKVIDPILSQFGFGSGGELIAQTAEDVTVRVEVWHQGGYVKSTVITMPIDDKGMAGKTNKTVLHGISSAISYCKRVGTCLLLNISTGDDKDGNGSGKRPEQGAATTPTDKFASRVSQQAKGNEAVRGDREIITEANTLKEDLKALRTKKEREELIGGKLGLLRDLENINRGEVVKTLHAIVAKGEIDAE